MKQELIEAVNEFTEKNLEKKGKYTYHDMQDAFILGWNNREKQDELTWEDIQAISGITDAVSNSAFERETNEELFTEVLNRFKEHKEYKKQKNE